MRSEIMVASLPQDGSNSEAGSSDLMEQVREQGKSLYWRALSHLLDSESRRLKSENHEMLVSHGFELGSRRRIVWDRT